MRKLKADGFSWKDRMILDLRYSQANSMAQLWERVVLPCQSTMHGTWPSCRSLAPRILHQARAVQKIRPKSI